MSLALPDALDFPLAAMYRTASYGRSIPFSIRTIREWYVFPDTVSKEMLAAHR